MTFFFPSPETRLFPWDCSYHCGPAFPFVWKHLFFCENGPWEATPPMRNVSPSFCMDPLSASKNEQYPSADSLAARRRASFFFFLSSATGFLFHRSRLISKKKSVFLHGRVLSFSVPPQIQGCQNLQRRRPGDISSVELLPFFFLASDVLFYFWTPEFDPNPSGVSPLDSI